MKNRVVAYVLAAACIACLPSVAAVRLGMPFSDHMVLQREKPVAVWGTADPGEKVVVSFADKTAEATADAAGDWRVNIGPFAASKEGRILKANAVEVKDVLVGEVWFAGGQSNMGVPLVWVDPRHGDEKGAMIAQYVRRPYVAVRRRRLSAGCQLHDQCAVCRSHAFGAHGRPVRRGFGARPRRRRWQAAL